MDPKRPYGDMTYFFIDMAEALGEPVPRDDKGQAVFSSEAEQRYERLHGEMLFAVQAFWIMRRAKHRANPEGEVLYAGQRRVTRLTPEVSRQSTGREAH